VEYASVTSFTTRLELFTLLLRLSLVIKELLGIFQQFGSNFPETSSWFTEDYGYQSHCCSTYLTYTRKTRRAKTHFQIRANL